MRRVELPMLAKILMSAVLVLASGPAWAEFVVVFDDPDTGGIDYEIVDNGPLDLDDTDIDGYISIVISDGVIDVVATAAEPETVIAASPTFWTHKICVSASSPT